MFRIRSESLLSMCILITCSGTSLCFFHVVHASSRQQTSADDRQIASIKSCTSTSYNSYSSWQVKVCWEFEMNLSKIINLSLISTGHKLTTWSLRLPSAWSPWWSYTRSNSPRGWSESWWASLLHLHFLSYGCRSWRKRWGKASYL